MEDIVQLRTITRSSNMLSQLVPFMRSEKCWPKFAIKSRAEQGSLWPIIFIIDVDLKR